MGQIKELFRASDHDTYTYGVSGNHKRTITVAEQGDRHVFYAYKKGGENASNKFRSFEEFVKEHNSAVNIVNNYRPYSWCLIIDDLEKTNWVRDHMDIPVCVGEAVAISIGGKQCILSDTQSAKIEHMFNCIVDFDLAKEIWADDKRSKKIKIKPSDVSIGDTFLNSNGSKNYIHKISHGNVYHNSREKSTDRWNTRSLEDFCDKVNSGFYTEYKQNMTVLQEEAPKKPFPSSWGVVVTEQNSAEIKEMLKVIFPTHQFSAVVDFIYGVQKNGIPNGKSTKYYNEYKYFGTILTFEQFKELYLINYKNNQNATRKENDLSGNVKESGVTRRTGTAVAVQGRQSQVASGIRFAGNQSQIGKRTAEIERAVLRGRSVFT